MKRQKLPNYNYPKLSDCCSAPTDSSHWLLFALIFALMRSACYFHPLALPRAERARPRPAMNVVHATVVPVLGGLAWCRCQLMTCFSSRTSQAKVSVIGPARRMQVSDLRCGSITTELTCSLCKMRFPSINISSVETVHHLSSRLYLSSP